MNQLPTGVVKELDVPVLLRRDGDGQSRVTQDFVDLTRRACNDRSAPLDTRRRLSFYSTNYPRKIL